MLHVNECVQTDNRIRVYLYANVCTLKYYNNPSNLQMDFFWGGGGCFQTDIFFFFFFYLLRNFPNT